jgi:NAD(P)-dependent dehydrogenase (short-subunit alcohol dehydrogenase family)
MGRLGFRVLLTSRGADGEAAALRLARNGIDVEHRRLDVVDAKSIEALAGQLRDEGRKVDVLVNNAGVYLDSEGARAARTTLEVNFFGPMRLTDALLDMMPAGAAVVMVSSGMGELSNFPPRLQEQLGAPALSRAQLLELMQAYAADVEQGRAREVGWPSAYRVSKAGLNALVRVLAVELSERRIRVNAVCPGWVRTEMGGRSAERSVEEGAQSIVATATLEDGPTGGIFRDGRAIDW